jgi:hypothetical protein
VVGSLRNLNCARSHDYSRSGLTKLQSRHNETVGLDEADANIFFAMGRQKTARVE